MEPEYSETIRHRLAPVCELCGEQYIVYLIRPQEKNPAIFLGRVPVRFPDRMGRRLLIRRFI